jgi:hypothetical protein
MTKTLFVPLESYPVARPLLFLLNTAHPSELPASFQVIEDPGGLKIQLRLAPLGEDVSPQVERTILAALLTELGMRSFLRADARADNVREEVPGPPRWLMDALLHKHHHPDPLLAPLKLRPIFEGDKIPALALLLARPENDIRISTDEEIDLSRCLLWMLSNRPESRSAMRELLKIDFTQNPLRSLQRVFPSFGSTDAALQKEWTLAIASYGTHDEILSIDGSKTQSEIESLLRLELTDLQAGRQLAFPLEQFSDFLRIPGARNALLTRQLEWIALQERAHFLYAAVIGSYANICGELAAGRTAGIARRLREATLERESVSARLSRVRDYMNWYEAVAAPRRNTAKLREFYRILDEKPRVSEAVTRALDKAEAALREQAEKEDIVRVIEEVRKRGSQGN